MLKLTSNRGHTVTLKKCYRIKDRVAYVNRTTLRTFALQQSFEPSDYWKSAEHNGVTLTVLAERRKVNPETLLNSLFGAD